MTTPQNDDTIIPPATPASAAPVGDSTNPASDSSIELEKLRLENADLLEQLKRERADFMNYRNRTRDESQDWFRKGKAEAVLVLAPVFENLHRAHRMLPETMREEAWAQGIANIIALSNDRLAQLKVERIATTGTPFDSSLHEAISQAEGPQGLVLHEVEPGYLLEGKPITAAKVVIGNGPENTPASTKSEP